MQASEHPRRGRRRPDLNINTASSNALSSSASRSRDVIPRTPPSRKPPPVSSKSKPGAASQALRPAPSSRHAEQDSFLDNPTPVGFEMADKENHRPREAMPQPPPPPRDFHDLSLSPRNVTRDSLMANMLLSLDQLGAGQANGQYGAANRAIYDDGEEPARTFTSNSRPPRTHTHSHSSDAEAADDGGRMSGQLSRGRRSNSSSNFQSTLGRINSMRESLRSSQPGTPRQMQSRGGRGSKHSSGSNSIDAGYAQVLSSQRWAQGFGGRSSSFDYGHRQSNSHAQTQWHIEFSNTFFNDDYDAAPTPTVPGGPRRAAAPISTPTPTNPYFSPPPEPPAEPRTPGLERKRSSRSAKSLTGRKAESKFSAREAVPPMPQQFEVDSAPAPHVGYEKSKEAVHGGPTSTGASSQGKDRPGFFRRVFGGSSSRSVNVAHGLDSQNSSTQLSSTSVETVDRPGSRPQHIASQMKQQSAPPSRDTSSSHSHHPMLQKKPSSFFRRRKKSVTDDAPPPIPTSMPPAPPPPPPAPVTVPPVNLQPGKDNAGAKPEPSPVSSLRRVMSPYLKGSPTAGGAPNPLSSHPVIYDPPLPTDAAATAAHDVAPKVDRYQRDFSPEYEPSPKARIRQVESEGANEVQSSSDAEPARVRRTDTPTRPPPEIPRPAEQRNNSFLHLDGPSDTEASTPSSKKAPRGDMATRDTDSPKPSKSKDRSDDTLRAKKKKSRRALQSPDSDEDTNKLALPIEGARSGSRASASTEATHKSSVSQAQTVDTAGSKDRSPKGHGDAKPLDEPEFIVGDPTEDDRQKARKIYDGNEDFIQKEKAAAWMGEEGVVRQRTLRAYMELYDFTSQTIVNSLREICGRLVFRAETQQVDRILVAFSKRWCDCNPNHGFKATDVIHTICYSIMLLNTDLHLADIEQKMTRGQFIKNTMTTIQQAAEDAAPHAFDRPTILPEGNGMLGGDMVRQSVDQDRAKNRMSFLPRSDSNTSNGEDSGPLVNAPFGGTKKQWEGQVESVLKDIYASIKDERLPLFGAEPGHSNAGNASQSNLSVMGVLKRTPSVLSKAPSESHSSLRGRINDASRTSTSRWGSKSRSRPRVFGGTGFSSSRTSFDDGNSIWSPTVSSATWSRYSLGRTQTSMSMDSFGSSWPRGDYQQSIGFANALSHAIVREDLPGGGTPSILSDDIKQSQLLEDESLELAGPPWVKEGIVIHKHHLDGIEKKSKDRTWTEVFAVVQKGHMSLFSFAPNKSMRSKGRSRNAGGPGPAVAVGGGNWQENATNLGTFSLRQTLASALPPPGYSRQRPHVWALSLPTGAVHLFQVGTPEIVKEFVTTANYWSARLSTHPLVGGISNIEYGWSEDIVNNDLVAAINESSAPAPPSGRNSRPGSSAATVGRSSIQSGSYRSASLDQGPGMPGSGGRLKLPGDRIHIAEWTPPTQSMRPSNMTEPEQLGTLIAYVKGIEDDLQVHNQLRSPMLLAFSPRGNNAARAMANWERRSAYLLREIVKFRTYVDCLQQAATRKNEIYTERELARRAARGDITDDDAGGDGDGDEIEPDVEDVTLRP